MSSVEQGQNKKDPGSAIPVRREEDVLGLKEVPADAYWGIHTARALENFPLSGRPMRKELVTAILQVKLACVRTNASLGHLEEEKASAIIMACMEGLEGRLDREFVVDALQGGAGTSANMNVNEVLANRAEEILGGRRGEHAWVHPLDHVNLHQSTNDVFPTSVKIAAMTGLKALEKSLADLQSAFQKKEQEFSGLVKIGRTQLQDASPMTMGAEFSAYSEAISRDRWRVFKCEERLRVVNLGGTAIGTGITAPRDYIFLVVDKLRQETGLGLSRAENLVDATQNVDCFVEVSGILKAVATNLFKISSDLRLLGSGPRAGLGELRLPQVQAGSSIMPGKVNPVICEAVGQGALRVMALDQLIGSAAMSGQLELNAFMPLLADALLESISLLDSSCRIFFKRCVKNLSADAKVCTELVSRSWATVVALVPVIGYEKAEEVAQVVKRTGCTVAEAVLETGFLHKDELEHLLSAEAMSVLGQGR